ncbi:MAG: putative pre6S rRNA nuclease [Actinomycetota bacterium]|nr:putative pre6S rRNA nuclease [Actinomycetota bacterium]
MRAVRALGLDLGSKRIGVAVSSGTLATPYEVVERGDDRARILELIEETGATVVVVGLPYSLDGSKGPAARLVEAEVDELRAALSVPVELWDERFSTVTAHQSLMEQKMKADARRRVVDKVAAAVMLQSWLDAQPRLWDGSTRNPG